MQKFTARFGALALIALLALGLAAPALAAPIKLDDATIFVQFWPEGEAGTNVVIVGTEIDTATPLPATVQLPLPKGATVFWAGEVSGADPASDVQRDFKLVDTPAGTVVEFTAETTRAVQFDATVGIIEIDGEDIVTSLDWIQSVASKTVSFAVRAPAAVQDVRITPEPPGEPQMNTAGEQLYTLADMVLRPGDTAKVDVRYTRAGSAPQSTGPDVLPILLGVLAVAIVALVVALMLQSKKRTQNEE